MHDHEYGQDGHDYDSDECACDEELEEPWHPEVWLDAHSDIIVPLWQRLRDDAYLTGMWTRSISDFAQAVLEWSTQPSHPGVDRGADESSPSEFDKLVLQSLFCIMAETRDSVRHAKDTFYDRQFLSHLDINMFTRFCLAEVDAKPLLSYEEPKTDSLSMRVL